MSAHSSLRTRRVREMEKKSHPGQAQASARKHRIRAVCVAQGLTRDEYYAREREKQIAGEAAAQGMSVPDYIAHRQLEAEESQGNRRDSSRHLRRRL